MCTDVQWDPTGRYVAAITDCTQQMENGYSIWSFHGRQLYRTPRDDLAMFAWRPRPAPLLTAEQEKKLQKELKQYSRKYDEEDQALLQAADFEVIRRREGLTREFEAWLKSKKEALDRRAAEAKK